MFSRIVSVIISLTLAAFSSIFVPMTGYASTYFNDPIAVPWPMFDAASELRLQAALSDIEWVDQGNALLNKRLAQISVRTALEDTERLHYDRG